MDRPFLANALMGTIGTTAKLFTKMLGEVKVFNGHILHDAVRNRSKGLPLITCANHRCTVDDPVIWGALLDTPTLFQASKMRWTLGAQELMFKNRVDSWFFSTGQVIPIVRGQGLNQPGVAKALQVLDAGEWVHVFPEGKINKSPDMLKLRWGCGKLVQAACIPPMVIPIFHDGLELIMPGSWLPHPFFKKLIILVGQPLHFDALLDAHRKAGTSELDVRIDITKRVETEICALQQKVTEWKQCGFV